MTKRSADTEGERLCDVCGNPVPARAVKCPFCESTLAKPVVPGRKRQRFTTINLEAGQPTAQAALTRLKVELSGCRQRGVTIARVIHGYGSSGKGGRIKEVVRAAVPGLKRAGLVRAAVNGEDYSELTEHGQRLLSAEPELRATLRSDRLNPGITMMQIS